MLVWNVGAAAYPTFFVGSWLHACLDVSNCSRLAHVAAALLLVAGRTP